SRFGGPPASLAQRPPAVPGANRRHARRPLARPRTPAARGGGGVGTRAGVRLRPLGPLPRPIRRPGGRGNRSDPDAAGRIQPRRHATRRAGQAAAAASGGEPGARRRRALAGPVVFADQRTGGRGGGAGGLVVLLALAHRELLQAAQRGRAADRGVAAGVGRGIGSAVGGGEHGLRGGLAGGASGGGAGGRVAASAGASERAADEAWGGIHAAGAVGRPVGVAGDDGGAEPLRPRRNPGPGGRRPAQAAPTQQRLDYLCRYQWVSPLAMNRRP